MADPTGRALALLGLLQTHRYWTGVELAERLDVSERTIRRDVDRLRALGYQVDAAPGVAGGYQLVAGTNLPPLLVDDDEAVALAIGLRAAAGSSIEGMEDATVRVLAKLEQTLPDRLRRRVESLHANVSVLRWAPPTGDVPVASLVVLAQACRDREEVRFEYRRRDGDESRRLVRPHALVVVGRRWYLVAFDVRRAGWRTFRVDRMEEPSAAGVRFELQTVPGGDAAAFVADSLSAAETRSVTGVVELAATPAELSGFAWWSDVTVEQLDARWCRVTMRADTEAWLVSMIAVLAAHCELRSVEVPGPVQAAALTMARRLAAVAG